jgi:hypothetical protein
VYFDIPLPSTTVSTWGHYFLGFAASIVLTSLDFSLFALRLFETTLLPSLNRTKTHKLRRQIVDRLIMSDKNLNNYLVIKCKLITSYAEAMEQSPEQAGSISNFHRLFVSSTC